MPYDKMILIQKKDEDTEEWVPFLTRHAEINRSKSREYEGGGAERSEQVINFRMRWSKSIQKIQLNTQLYQIVYKGAVYDITGYDDYKEQHQTVTLEAMSYARNS